MRIDTHQHFWKRSDGFYGWLTSDLGAIYRDFAPEDLAPHLSEHDIAATVLVQAAPSYEETKKLLSLGGRTDFVKAVIGWVDMDSAEAIQNLATLTEDPLFKGIRPMVQDLDDPDWLLRSSLEPVYERLISDQLVFEALVRPAHWSALRHLAQRYQSLSIVVDHGAKPAICNGMDGDGGFSEWAPMIDGLAAHPHVSCKLSGLLTEAAPGAGLNEIRPYLDHLYACFGPDRLMWGSDWPVLGLRADYGVWVEMFDAWLADKPKDAQEKILSRTAATKYGISLFSTSTEDQKVEA